MVPSQKKPSLKKLVLVKWRKKEWSKIIGSTSIPFQPAFPYWKPPPFLLLFSFAVPFCFQQKKHAAKSFGVWNPPQTDVWKTTFLKHHRFSWKFPRFPSFSFTGVSTEDENFLGFLPAVEIVQTFGTLLEPSHPATWCLERRKCPPKKKHRKK